jgi:hypothetical protein
MDLRVGKNYQLTKKIGSGAFGEIYEGINRKRLIIFRTQHLNKITCRYKTCI